LTSQIFLIARRFVLRKAAADLMSAATCRRPATARSRLQSHCAPRPDPEQAVALSSRTQLRPFPSRNNGGGCCKFDTTDNLFGLPESCQASKSKIFLFTRIPIYGIVPASPRHHEGRSRDRHGGLRWAVAPSGGSSRRTKRSQRTAKSCGPGAATLALPGKKGRFPGESAYKP
jgi:hypothetical protein